MLGWDDPRPLSTFIDPALARKLASKAGLKTVGDLLFNYPVRYMRAAHAPTEEDTRTEISSQEEDGYYSGIGTVISTSIRDMPPRGGQRRYSQKILSFRFDDGNTIFDSALFGNPSIHTGAIEVGRRLLFYGKMSRYGNQWQIKSPSYISLAPIEGQIRASGVLATIVDIAGDNDKASALLAHPLLAVYPRRTGSRSAELLAIMDIILDSLGEIPEVLPHHQSKHLPPWPQDPKTQEPLLSFSRALTEIHRPPPEGSYQARQRLAFNEALELQLIMALRRADSRTRLSRPIECPPLDPHQDSDYARLMYSLPFVLTEGQEKSLQRIEKKLSSTEPMSVLLQGDVGSGKTIVALLSMLRVVDAGYQAALIAPTEVLAQQHARTITTLLGNAATHTRLRLLTGSQSTAQRQEALLDILSGTADIAIGTHALIQEGVEFFDLGLVVVDEQHRFGVKQRDELRVRSDQDKTPHVLVMTATPIPRTVAMTYFGDLTPIALQGRPQGRKKISSSVVPEWKPHWLRRAFQRIREEVEQGRQAFIVAPRIDSDNGVEDIFHKLSQGPFQGLRMVMLHGRMSSEDKDSRMQAMSEGEIDILVATTVIEVGIDIPNATVMMVIESEKFGLSQLHQLRGRIGRGSYEGTCLLHTCAEENSRAWERLQQFSTIEDGFEIAELDLQYRTEGDILGEEQSGTRAKRTQLLDLNQDGELIELARDYATQLVSYDENLARSLVADYDGAEQEFIERT